MQKIKINSFTTVAFAALLLMFLIGVSAHGFEFSAEDLSDVGSLLSLYSRWASHHNVTTAAAEASRRFPAFVENVRFIDDFRKRGGSSTFTVGLNQYADLTNREFMTLYGGGSARRPVAPAVPRRNSTTATSSVVTHDQAPPASIDWRSLGAVTPVKNQGSTCQSCWAFGTVVAVEGYHQIKTGSLVSLSEQVLVDCDTGNNGCNPSHGYKAFDFVVSNGGIPSEDDYPYVGSQGTCNAVKLKTIAASITGAEFVTPNDENALLQAVAAGPVTSAIDASGSAFQFYKSGLFPGTCETNPNHDVGIVGYGPNYWLLKNSWGTTWGDGGYMQLERGVCPPAGPRGINTRSLRPV